MTTATTRHPPIDPRLVRRVPAVGRLLAGLALAWAADTALLVAQAVLVGRAVAALVRGAPLAAVAGTLAAVAVAGVLRALVAAGRDAGAATVGARARARLRADASTHALRCGRAAGPGGEVATALGHGFDALAPWFSGFVPALVGAVVVPPALVVWMLVVDVPSGLVVALTVPLVPLFMVLVGLRAAAWEEGQWATLERLSGHVVELLRGLPMLWLLRREHPQEQVLATVGGHLRRTTLAGLRVAFLSAFVLELVAMLGTAIVAVTIGLRLVSGGMDLAVGFAVLLVAPEVYGRLRDVGVRHHASRQGSLAATRVLDLLEVEPRPAVDGTRPAPDPGGVGLAVRGGIVEAAGRERALDGIDVDVPAGRLTAVVGASGAGKTTLARVLVGVQPLDGGHVTVGDVDLAALDPAGWRARAAWVPDWPTVVAGTLRDNLLLGDTEVADARVWAALVDVGGQAWVAGLPDGLGTHVGPGARDVSGGERARLGLARALLRGPRLLVVDEPTAHLDPSTAAVVEASLHAVRDGGATVVVVTHEPDLAARADHVVLLADGRLVEAGIPDDLLRRGGGFAQQAAVAAVVEGAT